MERIYEYKDLIKRFKRIFAIYKLDFNDLNDCVQEYVMYRLEGKSQHQFLRHFAFDYFIKQKKLAHYRNRNKHDTTRILRYPEVEKFGKNDNVLTKIDVKRIFEQVEKKYSKKKDLYKYKIFMDYFYYGDDQDTIAFFYKMTPSRISQILKEIIEKIKV